MRARLGLVVLLLGPLAAGAADTLDAVRTLLVAYSPFVDRPALGISRASPMASPIRERNNAQR